MDVSPVVAVGLVVFLAAFTQSLSGFGLALISMALLPALIGIRAATALVALIAVVIEVVLLLRYRQALEFRAIWRVMLASAVGAPLGIALLRGLDEGVAMFALGVVLVGYALYALLGLRLPRLERPLWAYLAGLLGGVLGGAYNTSGPPVILYADCQGWPPPVFKSNLQGYFLFSSLVVVTGHALGGSFTPEVWRLFWLSLPPIAVGLVAGMSLDRWLSPAAFRRVVQALLIVMGVRLMF